MDTDGDRAQEPGTVYAFRPGQVPVTPFPVPGVHFISLDENRVRALAAAMQQDVAELQRRLEQGARAALALLGDGTIAGFGWVSYDAARIYELQIHIPLPTLHAYIWDCATLPPYRGRGIFVGLLRILMEELRRTGTRQVWAGVAPGNGVSQRAFARAGFRLVAETTITGSKINVKVLPGATPLEAAWLRRLGAGSWVHSR